MKVPTTHINATKGDFAPVVLMPGDPKRAKYIAANFLENARLVNDVRGVQGYTGFYRGKPVSVMASGMGVPSMLIYSEELFAAYDVKAIIRVGTAGTIDPNIKLRDIMIVQSASSNGNVLQRFSGDFSLSAVASFSLMSSAKAVCEREGLNYKIANVLTSDYFYDEAPEKMKKAQSLNISAVEMECAALYVNAMRYKKEALTICSISDNILTGKGLDSNERETSFNSMIKVALEVAHTF